MKIAEARARVALVREALAGHPDVNSVGVGEKYRGEESQKTYAARVMVERKGKPKGEPIPPVVETNLGPMPTDVIEVPAATFQTISNKEIDGADIISDGNPQRNGTLAFVSRSQNGTFGITNAHVVAAPGEDARNKSVLAYLDGERTRIGYVAGHSPYRDDIINKHDVALIKLDAALNAVATYQIEPFKPQKIEKLGNLSAAPQGGSRRIYSYASKANGGLRRVDLTQVTEVPQGIILNDLQANKKLRFGRVFQLKVRSGAVLPGHSGSALVRALNTTDLIAVGILFAGKGDTAFALSWSDISQALAEYGA